MSSGNIRPDVLVGPAFLSPWEGLSASFFMTARGLSTLTHSFVECPALVFDILSKMHKIQGSADSSSADLSGLSCLFTFFYQSRVVYFHGRRTFFFDWNSSGKILRDSRGSPLLPKHSLDECFFPVAVPGLRLQTKSGDFRIRLFRPLLDVFRLTTCKGV